MDLLYFIEVFSWQVFLLLARRLLRCFALDRRGLSIKVILHVQPLFRLPQLAAYLFDTFHFS